MRLLLDSHAVLWWLAGDKRLTEAAREAIADPESLTWVSAATVWEIEIKARLGRLDLDCADLVDELAGAGFTELPVTARHARAAARLPPLHSDPFDRMILAQCLLEGMTCVTKDEALATYGVPLLW